MRIDIGKSIKDTILAFVFLTIIMTAIAFVGGAVGLLDEPEEFDRAAAETAAIERINDARQSEGLPPLSTLDRLQPRARAVSESNADTGELDHGQPRCSPGGENVAQTYWRETISTDRGDVYLDTSDEVGRSIANQWLNSSRHRSNIMDRRFSASAVGIVKSGDRVYATQRLCG
jgi:uncharacterized protein YkwD